MRNALAVFSDSIFRRCYHMSEISLTDRKRQIPGGEIFSLSRFRICEESTVNCRPGMTLNCSGLLSEEGCGKKEEEV